MPRARLAPAWFLGGSLLFSGSLYALALGAPRLVGVVTPFGGLRVPGRLGRAGLGRGDLEGERRLSCGV